MGAAESVVQEVGNAFESVGQTLENVGQTVANAVNESVDFIGDLGEDVAKGFLSIPQQLAAALGKPCRGVPISDSVQERTGSTIDDLIAAARAEFGIDPNCYNFIFTGISGSGKSSIINALRGVEDDSPDAAKVDEVECTTELAKYVHPTNPSIVLWDLPGGGTQSHGSYGYFFAKKLYAFDTVILISDRFMALDVDIAYACEKMDVPVVFVRSKSDAAIDSRAFRLKKPKKEVKEGAKAAIIEKIKTELPETLHHCPMFVVSARVIGGAYDDVTREDYVLDEVTFMNHVLNTAKERRG